MVLLDGGRCRRRPVRRGEAASARSHDSRARFNAYAPSFSGRKTGVLVALLVGFAVRVCIYVAGGQVLNVAQQQD